MFKRKNDDLVNTSCGNVNGETNMENAAVEAVKENVPAGIVGALLGGILGSVLIVLFGMLGFVASLGGVVVAVTTLTGYEKFAKKLSVKGIVISVIIMIIVIAFVTRLVWTIDIYSEMVEYSDEVSPLAIFLNMNAILKEFDCVADYVKEIVMLFIFTGIGAVPTIKKKYIEKTTPVKETKTKSLTEIATSVEE